MESLLEGIWAATAAHARYRNTRRPPLRASEVDRLFASVDVARLPDALRALYAWADVELPFGQRVTIATAPDAALVTNQLRESDRVRSEEEWKLFRGRVAVGYTGFSDALTATTFGEGNVHLQDVTGEDADWKCTVEELLEVLLTTFELGGMYADALGRLNAHEVERAAARRLVRQGTAGPSPDQAERERVIGLAVAHVAGEAHDDGRAELELFAYPEAAEVFMAHPDLTWHHYETVGRSGVAGARDFLLLCLEKARRDGNSSALRAAIEGLSFLRDPSTVASIVESRPGDVPESAVGTIGGPVARSVLLSRLQLAEGRFRRRPLYYLSGLLTPDDRPLLHRLIREYDPATSDLDVLVGLLGQVGTAEDLDLLAAMGNHPHDDVTTMASVARLMIEDRTRDV